MKNQNSLCAAIVGILMLASIATAQSKTVGKPADPLAKAALAAEFRHDLAGAAKLYRQVADDDKQPDKLRARAYKGLGDVLLKSGQKKKARTAYLNAARWGYPNPPMVKKTVLSANIPEGFFDDDQDGDLLKGKVMALIKRFRMGDNKAVEELKWIGKPVLPFVLDTIREEKNDISFLSRATALATGLDAAEAIPKLARLATDQDILRKRAILRGMPEHVLEKHRVASVEAVSGFLKDESAQVRADVASKLVCILPLREILSTLPGLPEPQRKRVLMQVASGWLCLRHEGGQPEAFRAVLPWLEKWDGEPTLPSGGLQRALGSSDHSCFGNGLAGRKAFLRAVQLPFFHRVRLNGKDWPLTEGKRPDGPLLVSEVMAAVKQLGPIPKSDSGRRKPTVAHANLAQFIDPATLCWDRSTIEDVLTLVTRYGYEQLGTKGSIVMWLIRQMTADDLVLVSQHLTSFPRRGHLLVKGFRKHNLPVAAVPGLRAFAENHIRTARNTSKDVARVTCEAILKAGSKEAVDYLLGLVRKHGTETNVYGLWGSVATEVLVKARGPVAEQAQLRMMTMDDRSQYGPWMREMAALALTEVGSKAAISRYAKAYALGLPARGARIRASLRDLLPGMNYYSPGKPEKGAVLRRSRYTAEEELEILRSCLETGKDRAFVELVYLLGRGAPLPKTVLSLVVQKIDAFPTITERGGKRRNLRLEAIAKLAHGYGPTPSVRSFLISALRKGDDETRYEIVEALPEKMSKDPALIEAVVNVVEGAENTEDSSNAGCGAVERLVWMDSKAFLARAEGWITTHQVPAIRIAAAEAYVRQRAANAIPVVGPLLSDPATGPRCWGLMEQMGLTMDIRAVPFLIKELKNPQRSQYQRESIKKALEQIRFFHEQEQLWDRISRKSELSQSSAAEALIEQCKSKDRQVRLTAIRSLGTLAVAETLPFLIRLMSDSDKDVAAAAKESADRINAKARRAANK